MTAALTREGGGGNYCANRGEYRETELAGANTSAGQNIMEQSRYDNQ